MELVKEPVISSDIREWQDIITTGNSLIGDKVPLNCYGFVREVYKKLKIELPERIEGELTPDIIRQEEGENWKKVDGPHPNCVVLLRNNEGGLHLGVVTKDMFVLHYVPGKGMRLSKLYRLKNVILGYYVYKHGGGDYIPDAGSGDTGRIIGMVVVAIVAIVTTYFTGGAAATYWGSMYGAATGSVMGSITGALAGMAVSMIGNMLVNAAFPVEGSTNSGYTGDLASSRHYTWDGILNEARQGAPKPILIGKLRVGGQIISEHYWTDTVKAKSYYDVLICPGMGRISRLSDTLVNGSPITFFKGVSAYYRYGEDEQSIIPIFSKVYTQYVSGAKVVYDSSIDAPEEYTAFRSKAVVSEAEIEFSAPGGLWVTTLTNSTPSRLSVRLRAQKRMYPGGEWVDFGGDPLYDNESTGFIKRNYGYFTGSDAKTLTDGTPDTSGDSWKPSTYYNAGDTIVPTEYANTSWEWVAASSGISGTTEPGWLIEQAVVEYDANGNGLISWIPQYVSYGGNTSPSNARFSSVVSLNGMFTLIDCNGITYYCNQYGTLTSNEIGFVAYLDEARTMEYDGTIPDGTYVVEIAGRCSYDVSDFSGRYVLGFKTPMSYGCKFTLRSYSNAIPGMVFYWSMYKVYYRIVGESSWTLYDTYEVGTKSTASRANSEIGIELPAGYCQYEVRVNWVSDSCSDDGGEHNIDAFAITDFYLAASAAKTITMTGKVGSPTSAIYKVIKTNVMVESMYDFRVWRITKDSDSYRQQDDVYIRSYTEILNKQLTYPNHPLIGVRALATDRLSGSRPTITTMLTGEPLTIPKSASERVTTTIVSDGGIVAEDTFVNGSDVSGMRAINIADNIPGTAPTKDAPYCAWIVWLDSDGFAQSDRQLTKFFQRVETWNDKLLYVNMTQNVSSGASIMVFSEQYAPIDNLAWAVTKVMLQGSRGRITSSKIDWDSFSEWNDWNETLIYDDLNDVMTKRHQFDAVIDFSVDLQSIILRMMTTGRAMPAYAGGLFGVSIDKAEPAIMTFDDVTNVAIFAEGNANNSSLSLIPRSDRANTLVCDYQDEAGDKHTISESDVVYPELPILTTIPLQVGVKREFQVRKYLRYLLRQNRYIDYVKNMDVGFDSLQCRVGDIILSQSKANDLAMSGRIKYVGSTEITLDQTFTANGETYNFYVWGSDNKTYRWQGTLTGTDIETVPIPTGFTMVNRYDCPYILAKITSLSHFYRIHNISRSGNDFTAQIKGLEYRTEVYAEDDA